MTNYKKILIIYFFAILLVSPLSTFSIGGCRELEVPIPGLTSTCLPALPDYIAAIYNFALMIVGIVVFGALIYGGFRYLTSVGNPAAIADAKDQIFSAILGLIILFSAWLILNTINPELVILGQAPPPTLRCTKDADCPSQTCTAGKCSISGKACSVDADCKMVCNCQPQTCSEGKCSISGKACIVDADCVCWNGFCTDLTQGGWGCSAHTDSGTCGGDANCQWCPKCSGTQTNSYQQDMCINKGINCMYGCVEGKCGACTSSPSSCPAGESCIDCVCQ